MTRRGPHLSSVPAERRLQVAVLVVIGAFLLFFVWFLGIGIGSFVAEGTTPEAEAAREAWAEDNGLDLLRTTAGVVMPLALLVLPVTAWLDRQGVATTAGLKGRWLAATFFGGVFTAIWSHGPLGLAVIAVSLLAVAVLPSRPRDEQTARIEGGSLG